MKKSLYISVVFLLLFTFTISAQTKIPQAKGKDIVFIMKLVFEPELPLDFYANYKHYSATAKGSTIQIFLEPVKKRPKDIMLAGEIGEFMAAKTTKESGLSYKILHTHLQFTDNDLLMIKFPFNLYTTPPDDAQYVYLGTFLFEYADEWLTLTSISKVDEYDELLAELKAAYGSDVNLVRATLREEN